MKKVLIIANLSHHPSRVLGISKYLHEFGWSPTIISACGNEPSLYQSADTANNCRSEHQNLGSDVRYRVIETKFREVLSFWQHTLKIAPQDDLRAELQKRTNSKSKTSAYLLNSVVTLASMIACYPDADKGWLPFAVEASSKLLELENTDAIISTSAPFTSHLIGKKVKEQFAVPWIADFRDLWSENHNYGYGWLKHAIDKRFEVRTMRSADALITVAEPFAEKLQQLHKGKAVYTITNGFDPEDFCRPPIKLTPQFTITYTGAIYKGKQDPILLFEALSGLIADQTINADDVEVRFFGSGLDWLEEAVKDYKLSRVVKLFKPVPRSVAFDRQRESHVLLHLTWEDDASVAGYSLKLFDYLAAKRPILATGRGNDMTVKLLQETAAGIYCETVEDLQSVLERMYLGHRSHREVTEKPNTVAINAYSYRSIAKRFSDVLDVV